MDETNHQTSLKATIKRWEFEARNRGMIMAWKKPTRTFEMVRNEYLFQRTSYQLTRWNYSKQ